jgi:hypothetical protein
MYAAIAKDHSVNWQFQDFKRSYGSDWPKIANELKEIYGAEWKNIIKHAMSLVSQQSKIIMN